MSAKNFCQEITNLTVANFVLGLSRRKTQAYFGLVSTFVTPLRCVVGAILTAISPSSICELLWKFLDPSRKLPGGQAAEAGQKNAGLHRAIRDSE